MEEIDKVESKVIKTEKKQISKTKLCKVLFYDKLKNILHLDFDGFGIQINYNGVDTKEINIQYTSEIGKPDFTFKLAK